PPAAPVRRCRHTARCGGRARTRPPGAPPRAAGDRAPQAVPRPRSLLLLPLEVRHELLRVGSRHDLHQFPAVLTPVVQDLLGGVDQQRHRRVFPLRHGPHCSHARPSLRLPGVSGSASTPPRLHVVSGKGGTGKTTVAAALALALAEEGRRTLLVEVEGRQGIAQLFETEALPYEERRIAIGPGGGEVFALAIDAEQALLDYLQMFYKLGGAGRALRRLGAISFATTVAPGVRDVLLTGKACEAVRRRGPGGRLAYDAVVMDAPPTGRIARFLGVNDEVAGLARVGPIHHQAQAVMRVLKSRETAVHLVSLLEEMPVQETADGVAELRAAGLPVGCVVVNMV